MSGSYMVVVGDPDIRSKPSELAKRARDPLEREGGKNDSRDSCHRRQTNAEATDKNTKMPVSVTYDVEIARARRCRAVIRR